MNMQSDIAASAINGVRFEEPRIDPVAWQAEVDAVVTLANARRRGLKRLSEFSIAPARLDDDFGDFTQIRAVPVTGFKGCEFRFQMPKGHPGDHKIEDRVESLLIEAAAFCQLRNLEEYIELVKAVIADGLAPTIEDLSPMKLVAIGVKIDVANSDHSLVVELERLGRDLRPGIDRISGRDIDALEQKLAKSVAEHQLRGTLRTAAAASRAIGWIDGTALNIMDAAGMSHSDGVALLREQESVEFYFGGHDGFDHYAALYWDDGVIRGDVDGTANEWRFCRNHLSMLNLGLPETVLAAWPGRRFGDVVKNRFVPADAIVTRVQTSGEWIYVDLVIGQCLVDASAGQPRADRIA